VQRKIVFAHFEALHKQGAAFGPGFLTNLVLQPQAGLLTDQPKDQPTNQPTNPLNNQLLND
jgi:hypothetical protein